MLYVGPYWFSILHIVMCICSSQPPNLSLAHFSPSVIISIFLSLWVCLCFVNKLIYIISKKFNIWVILCDICLCLTSLSMIISRSIYVVKMALFHSFLWLSNIPLYIYIYIDTLYIYIHTHTLYIFIFIYTTSSLSIPLLVDIYFAFMSWQL